MSVSARLIVSHCFSSFCIVDYWLFPHTHLCPWLQFSWVSMAAVCIQHRTSQVFGLVSTVPCFLEVIIQTQLVSTFISPRFSLSSSKYSVTAIIPYPRLTWCEQSAAELWRLCCDSVCKVSLTTVLWLPKLPTRKNWILRPIQNSSKWFSAGKCMSGVTVEYFGYLLSDMYLRAYLHTFCFVSEYNKSGQ